MKDKYSNNFLDSFINIFRRFKIFAPLIKIYDKYKESILYLFFGALTTLVNIVVYTLLARLFKIDYMASNIIAWILSVIFAYITNKVYVFESSTTSKKGLVIEIFSFFIARILSLVLDVLVMYIGIYVLNGNDIVVKVLSNILVIIANYFMSKLFVFRKK